LIDTDADITTYDLDKEAAQRISDLEQELQFSRENLQATIEELEAGQAKLRQQVHLCDVLSRLSNLFEKNDISIHSVAQQVVDLVPLSYAPTDKITCRLEVEGHTCESVNFQSSACKASHTIDYGHSMEATITVFDLSPEVDPETCRQYETETHVLRIVADRLAILFSKLQSE
jgi:hypothetical protein